MLGALRIGTSESGRAERRDNVVVRAVLTVIRGVEHVHLPWRTGVV